jgi:hypothetical protein
MLEILIKARTTIPIKTNPDDMAAIFTRILTLEFPGFFMIPPNHYLFNQVSKNIILRYIKYIPNMKQMSTLFVEIK